MYKFFIISILTLLWSCSKVEQEEPCQPVKCRTITYGISVCPPGQTIIVHPDTSYFDATTCTMLAFQSGLTVQYDRRGPQPQCDCEIQN